MTATINFENYIQEYAFKTGEFSLDEALKFQSVYSLFAMTSGPLDLDIQFEEYGPETFIRNKDISLEDALKITGEPQMHAFRAGASLEDSLKLTHDVALWAFNAGVPAEDAIKFTHDNNLRLLKFKELSIEDILKFNREHKIAAYETGRFSLAEALEITEEQLCDLFKSDSSVEQTYPCNIAGETAQEL